MKKKYMKEQCAPASAANSFDFVVIPFSWKSMN